MAGGRKMRRFGSATRGVIGLALAASGLVACADEWVELGRMQIDGAYVAPQDILKPGDALRDGV